MLNVCFKSLSPFYASNLIQTQTLYNILDSDPKAKGIIKASAVIKAAFFLDLTFCFSNG